MKWKWIIITLSSLNYFKCSVLCPKFYSILKQFNWFCPRVQFLFRLPSTNSQLGSLLVHLSCRSPNSMAQRHTQCTLFAVLKSDVAYNKFSVTIPCYFFLSFITGWAFRGFLEMEQGEQDVCCFQIGCCVSSKHFAMTNAKTTQPHTQPYKHPQITDLTWNSLNSTLERRKQMGPCTWSAVESAERWQKCPIDFCGLLCMSLMGFMLGIWKIPAMTEKFLAQLVDFKWVRQYAKVLAYLLEPRI